MAAPAWPPEQCERRKRVLLQLLSMLVDSVQAMQRKRQPGRHTRLDAVHEVRRMQDNVFSKFSISWGAETAEAFHRLVEQILDELERTAAH